MARSMHGIARREGDARAAYRNWSQANPAGRRSINPAAIWVGRDGREVHFEKPTFDPRAPYDPDWRRVR